MADRHSAPSTGNGKDRSRGPLGKAEVNVQSSGGAFLWKQIAKLWGSGDKPKS